MSAAREEELLGVELTAYERKIARQSRGLPPEIFEQEEEAS